MRIRTIKPEFWRSEDIAALSIEDRLLFIGLWSYVEDNGVGRDEPQLIQCDLYPLDTFTEASVRTHGGLTRLSQQGLITRFEGPDGRRYLQINSWDKHQKINRPSKPRFPQYNAENCTLTEGSLSPHCTLSEGSLPEQGTGNREQGTGRLTLLGPSHETEHAESASAELATVSADAAPATANTSKPSKRTRAARGTRLPDGWQPDQALADWTKVNAPAAANALEVERFRDYWQSLSGQRAIRVNWSATWRNWARKCQEQHTQPNRGPAPRSTTSDRVNGWLALAESLNPNHQPTSQPSLIAIEGGAA
nr:MAG TPA: replisome organizer [Caudoviricetes sp.]